MNDKGAGLHLVGEQYMRHLLGNRMVSRSGLAMHGANFENVLTSLANAYCVKGIMYSGAAKPEIDLSTLAGLPPVPLEIDQTQLLGIEIDAADNTYISYGKIVENALLDSGQRELDWPVTLVQEHTMLGVVQVRNNAAAPFIFGTSLLNDANLVVTFYDVAIPSY